MIIAPPKDAISEIVSERGTFSKTFALPGNKRMCRTSLGPAHYTDGKGLLKDIDLTWVKEGRNVVLRKAPYDAVIRDNRIHLTYTSKRGGAVRIIFDKANNRLTGLTSIPQIRGRTLLYSNIMKDMDIEVMAKPHGIEVFKILKSALAPKKLEFIVEHDGFANIDLQRTIKGHDDANLTRAGIRPRRMRIDRTETPMTDTITGNKRFRVTETWSGESAMRNRKTGALNWSMNGGIYPMRIDVTVNESIVANNDDGDENVASSAWRPDGPGFGQWVGQIASSYHGGYRFQTVAVPKSATISSATLTLTNNSIDIGTDVSVKVVADDVDNAAAWSNTSRPSQITQTTASTIYSLTGLADATNAIDVTSIIQEIVNRSGWASDNALRLAALDNGNASYVYAYLRDYGSDPAKAATLDIIYSSGIDLGATCIGSGSLISSLTTQINLAATTSGAAFSVSNLQTAIDLLATTTASAQAVATILGVINFRAEALGSGFAQGNLVNSVEFGATTSSRGFCLADLLTQINLRATSIGRSTAEADLLSFDSKLNASVLGSGSVSSDMTSGINLSASALSTAFSQSNLQTAITLAAETISTGSASADIAQGIIFRALGSMSGQAEAALNTQINLACQMLASAEMSADLFNGVIVAIILANDGDAFFATINDGNADFATINDGDAFLQ